MDNSTDFQRARRRGSKAPKAPPLSAPGGGYPRIAAPARRRRRSIPPAPKKPLARGGIYVLSGGAKPKARPVSAKPRAIYMKILAFIFFSLAAVYIGSYAVTLAGRRPAPTARVAIGSVDTIPVQNGIIFRDEAVAVSGFGGVIRSGALEGERVKTGDDVCTIDDPSAAPGLIAGVGELDEKIVEMQTRRDGLSRFKADVDASDAKIRAAVEENAARLGDGESLYALKRDLEREMRIRNNIIFSDVSGSASRLAMERAAAVESLSAVSDTMSAASSGFVSYAVDGREDEFTFDRIGEITKSQASGTIKVESRDMSIPVKPGDAVYKIVRSNVWRVAAYVKADDAKALLESCLPVNGGAFSAAYVPSFIKETIAAGGAAEKLDYRSSDARVFIRKAEGDEFEPYDAVLETMTDPDASGDCFITLRFDKYIMEFMGARSLSFKLSNNDLVGLKIPSSAVAEKTLLMVPKKYITDVPANYLADGAKAVVKFAAGERIVEVISVTSETKTLEELFEADAAWVAQDVNALKYGDVIVSPDDVSDFTTLTETRRVRGVYVMNSGVPIFKELNFDGSMQGGRYIVFDATKNTGIKEMDKIISDVMKVTG